MAKRAAIVCTTRTPFLHAPVILIRYILQDFLTRSRHRRLAIRQMQCAHAFDLLQPSSNADRPLRKFQTFPCRLWARKGIKSTWTPKTKMTNF